MPALYRIICIQPGIIPEVGSQVAGSELGCITYMIPGAVRIIDAFTYFKYVFHAFNSYPFIGNAVFGDGTGCALDPEAQWCVWRDLLFSLHDIGITEVRALLLPAALDASACIQK